METTAYLEIFQAAGPVGVFVYLILMFGLRKQNGKDDSTERVEGFVGAVSDSVDSLKAKVDTMESQLADLHLWHSKEDEVGIKTWYVRRDLVEAQTRALEEIGRSSAALRDDVRSMTDSAKGLREEIKGLHTAIDKLSGEWRRVGGLGK